MTRSIQTASHCENNANSIWPCSYGTRRIIIDSVNGERKATWKGTVDKAWPVTYIFYSSRRRRLATTSRRGWRWLEKAWISSSLVRPSTRASLVTSRTYHSLSTRLHTGFRGTAARNHREHNLIHRVTRGETGPDDRLSIGARSKWGEPSDT